MVHWTQLTWAYRRLYYIPHILRQASPIANWFGLGNDPFSNTGREPSGSSRRWRNMRRSTKESSCSGSWIENRTDTGSLAFMISISFAFYKEIGQMARSGRMITHDLEVEMTIWTLYCIWRRGVEAMTCWKLLPALDVVLVVVCHSIAWLRD